MTEGKGAAEGVTAAEGRTALAVAAQKATWRDTKISAAVKFLSNESVRPAPRAEKLLFLGKRLTLEEVDEAFRRHCEQEAERLNEADGGANGGAIGSTNGHLDPSAAIITDEEAQRIKEPISGANRGDFLGAAITNELANLEREPQKAEEKRRARQREERERQEADGSVGRLTETIARACEGAQKVLKEMAERERESRKAEEKRRARQQEERERHEADGRFGRLTETIARACEGAQEIKELAGLEREERRARQGAQMIKELAELERELEREEEKQRARQQEERERHEADGRFGRREENIVRAYDCVQKDIKEAQRIKETSSGTNGGTKGGENRGDRLAAAVTNEAARFEKEAGTICSTIGGATGGDCLAADIGSKERKARGRFEKFLAEGKAAKSEKEAQKAQETFQARQQTEKRERENLDTHCVGQVVTIQGRRGTFDFQDFHDSNDFRYSIDEDDDVVCREREARDRLEKHLAEGDAANLVRDAAQKKVDDRRARQFRLAQLKRRAGLSEATHKQVQEAQIIKEPSRGTNGSAIGSASRGNRLVAAVANEDIQSIKEPKSAVNASANGSARGRDQIRVGLTSEATPQIDVASRGVDGDTDRGDRLAAAIIAEVAGGDANCITHVVGQQRRRSGFGHSDDEDEAVVRREREARDRLEKRLAEGEAAKLEKEAQKAEEERRALQSEEQARLEANRARRLAEAQKAEEERRAQKEEQLRLEALMARTIAHPRLGHANAKRRKDIAGDDKAAAEGSASEQASSLGPEKRIASDFKAYCWEEWEAFFKQDAQKLWGEAPIDGQKRVIQWETSTDNIPYSFLEYHQYTMQWHDGVSSEKRYAWLLKDWKLSRLPREDT